MKERASCDDTITSLLKKFPRAEHVMTEAAFRFPEHATAQPYIKWKTHPNAVSAQPGKERGKKTGMLRPLKSSDTHKESWRGSESIDHGAEMRKGEKVSEPENRVNFCTVTSSLSVLPLSGPPTGPILCVCVCVYQGKGDTLTFSSLLIFPTQAHTKL